MVTCAEHAPLVSQHALCGANSVWTENTSSEKWQLRCFRHFTNPVSGDAPEEERRQMLITAVMPLGMSHGLGRPARLTPFSTASSCGLRIGTSAKTPPAPHWASPPTQHHTGRYRAELLVGRAWR
jgi:hypothetical protein